MREWLTANFALPVARRAGGDQPELRAALLASQLIGFGLGRYVLSFDPLATTPSDQLVSVLGAILQHTCTGALGSVADRLGSLPVHRANGIAPGNAQAGGGLDGRWELEHEPGGHATVIGLPMGAEPLDDA